MRKLPIIFIFLAALMIASCRSSKSEMTHRAKENLEASLDYPKQLKIIAHSQPDSAFGVTYFTRNEMTGINNLWLRQKILVIFLIVMHILLD